MFKEEPRNFIIGHLSGLLGTFLLFFFCIVLLPFGFRKSPEESLIPLMGHVTDMQFSRGSTAFENTFTFSIEEYPRKSFAMSGLRPVDQTLLTSWEHFEANFKIWVEETDFRMHESGIQVYGFSTPVTMYLEVGSNALDSEKARYLVYFLEVVFLASGLAAYFYLKSTYQREQLKPLDFSAIDPLMLIVCRFMVYWKGSSEDSADAWFKTILDRHHQRLHELSERLVTVAPKHLKAVQLLLKHGAKVNVQDKKGRTPLSIAAGAGEVEAVALLIRKGADPNLVDEVGNTPLMIAAEKGHLGVVMKLLRSGAKVNIENAEGASAISLAEANTRNKAVSDVLSTASIQEKLAEEKAAKKAAKKAEKKKS